MSIPAITDQTSLYSSLNQYVHQETDQRSWVGRLWSSVKTICQKKPLTGAAVITGITIANVYNIACSTLLLKGSYHSLNETYTVLANNSTLVHEPGDAGGWMILALLNTVAIGTGLFYVIKNGDYLRLKSLSRHWYKEVEKQGIEIEKEEFYSKVEEMIDSVGSECWPQANLIDQKIYALNIMKKLEKQDMGEGIVYDLSSHLSIDKQLESTYQHIQRELDSALGSRRYFTRFHMGLKAIGESYGACTQCVVLVNGVALPIILVFGAFLSMCGEVVLVKEVLFEGKDILLTGHLGEWPINIVEALFGVGYLHNRFILNEGDFAVSKKILGEIVSDFKSKMNEDEKDIESGSESERDKKLYRRLCKVANAELQRLASQCAFSKLPLDYQLK